MDRPGAVCPRRPGGATADTRPTHTATAPRGPAGQWPPDEGGTARRLPAPKTVPCRVPPTSATVEFGQSNHLPQRAMHLVAQSGTLTATGGGGGFIEDDSYRGKPLCSFSNACRCSACPQPFGRNLNQFSLSLAALDMNIDGTLHVDRSTLVPAPPPATDRREEIP